MTTPAFSAERQFEFRDADFARVRQMIYARAGISLGAHKREMVYSRLARRLRALGQQEFRVYLDGLENEPAAPEWEDFVNALTTNLTAFFRESHHFPILADFAPARRAGIGVVLRRLDRRRAVLDRHDAGREPGRAPRPARC